MNWSLHPSIQSGIGAAVDLAHHEVAVGGDELPVMNEDLGKLDAAGGEPIAGALECPVVGLVSHCEQADHQVSVLVDANTTVVLGIANSPRHHQVGELDVIAVAHNGEVLKVVAVLTEEDGADNDPLLAHQLDIGELGAVSRHAELGVLSGVEVGPGPVALFRTTLADGTGIVSVGAGSADTRT